MKSTQEKLEEIKIKLDKDFSAYIYTDSIVYTLGYSVYYEINVLITTQEFWNRLMKYNLAIYEINSINDLIILKIYVGDIRKLKGD